MVIPDDGKDIDGERAERVAAATPVLASGIPVIALGRTLPDPHADPDVSAAARLCRELGRPPSHAGNSGERRAASAHPYPATGGRRRLPGMPAALLVGSVSWRRFPRICQARNASWENPPPANRS